MSTPRRLSAPFVWLLFSLGALCSCELIASVDRSNVGGQGGGGGGSEDPSAELTMLTVEPSKGSVGEGESQQFRAIGVFADQTMRDVTGLVTWAATKPSVATVNDASHPGLVTGVGPGSTAISALLGKHYATAELGVSALTTIQVAPAQSTLVQGSTRKLTATGQFQDGHQADLSASVMWASDETSVAAVDGTGLLTAASAGSTTIRATRGSVAGSATVTVTASQGALVAVQVSPPAASIAISATQRFTATAVYASGATSDVTPRATWSSSPSSIATIGGGTGLATAKARGTATIEAVFEGMTGTAGLVVTEPRTLVSFQISPSDVTLAQGRAEQLQALGNFSDGSTENQTGTVTWSSSSPAVATVSNLDGTRGLVLGVSPGLATITVTSSGDKRGLATVMVLPAPPQLDSVSPSKGPLAGGNTVSIAGHSFAAPATVKFGSKSVTGTVVSSSLIDVVVPEGGQVGPVGVSVQTPAGVSNALTYRYVSPPSITSLNPGNGPAAGGNMVMISGTFLTDASAVAFGPTPAPSYTVVSDSLILAIAPAGMGSVDVSVTTPDGTSNSKPYAYEAAPTVSALVPDAGPVEGGNTVTVTGRGYVAGSTTVTFGTTAATAVMVMSATELICVVPAGSAGSVDVSVTTPYGASNKVPYRYVTLPVLTSLSPGAGPPSGGGSITILGSGLGGVTAVKFGSNPAVFHVHSDTQISATVPAGSGSVEVTAENPSGLSNGLLYVYALPAPFIVSLGPTTGSPGTSVTITGSNFVGVTGVKFGATPAASFTVNSPQQITAVAPAGSGGASVTVTTRSGTSNGVSFTYVPVTISLVSPGAGPEAGGTTVTVTGTNFTGAIGVTFGMVPASSFTLNSATQITVTAPAGTGTVDVTVTTGSGSGTASNAYEYLPAPTLTQCNPGSGLTTGGQAVTLTGTGFTWATSVTFGGLAATSFTVDSATQITAVTPAAPAGAADVVVTTPGGSATLSNGLTYAVTVAPVVTSCSPNFGPTTGGTPVAIYGTGFTGATDVTFGGVSASFTVASDTQINAIIPAAAAGAVDVVVTNPSGTDTLVNGFTYF